MRRALTTMAALCVGACASGPAALVKQATGSVSQVLCSKVFIANLDPEDVMRDHLLPEPGMSAIAWALRYDIDRDLREVSARALGVESRAVYREGRGCTLTYPGTPTPDALTPLPHAEATLPEIAGPDVVTPVNPLLAAALDAAFAEPAKGAPRRTQAVVIVQGGRVIAERYAPGFTPETPVLSHSIAKSVVNALMGVLVRDGRLRVEDETGLAQWRDDDRAPITFDNLLRMNAGFGFDEGSGASVATAIWYTQPDMTAASSKAMTISAPGAQWGYCDRCYIILSHLIGENIGGGPQGVLDFAQREVFDPLGMRSVTLEFDPSGTLMGANSMFATPRDWARFGLLYLNDGIVSGRRILPEGWVAYSARPTGEAGYGAGFWLNSTDADIPEWRMPWGIPGAPRDAFAARGYMGQYVVIVPSEDLVVVRFGQSHGRSQAIDSVGALVGAVSAIARGERE